MLLGYHCTAVLQYCQSYLALVLGSVYYMILLSRFVLGTLHNLDFGTIPWRINRGGADPSLYTDTHLVMLPGPWMRPPRYIALYTMYERVPPRKQDDEHKRNQAGFIVRNNAPSRGEWGMIPPLRPARLYSLHLLAE